MSRAQKAFIAELQLRINRLRETAVELDADSIHRSHAANRIRLMVNEMAEIIVAKVAKEAKKGRKK